MEANSGLWPKKIRLTVCLNEALNEELRRASLEQDKLISAISRGVLTQWALARAAACLNAGMAVSRTDFRRQLGFLLCAKRLDEGGVSCGSKAGAIAVRFGMLPRVNQS
jgi:hypothetical protein